LKKEDAKFEGIRERLIGMRQNLIRESKAEINQILEAGEKYNGVSDDGDLADIAARDSMKAANLTRQQSRLRAIEEALQKIDNGGYGICEDCDEDIPVGRLNVMPFALRCIECQEKYEMVSSRRKQTVEDSSILPAEENEE